MPFKNRAEARAAASKGGKALAAKRKAAREPRPPYAGSMLDALRDAGMTGASWSAWLAFWRVVSGAELSEADLEVFTRCTGRQRVPAGPLRELTLIVGRRGGKSRNLALLALHTAVRRDYAPLLAEGERAVVAVVAADRKQAAQVLRFLRGMIHREAFAPYVRRSLKDSIEFATGCDVQVMTASHATVRGYSLAAVLADEVSFWNTDEAGASPDTEILAALRPGLANVPGSLLVLSSTPYAQRGALYAAYTRHYGKDDADGVLVWQAASAAMNPTLDPQVIEQAYQDDPSSASAEYGASFRTDVQSLFDPAVLAAVVVAGRHELPPVPGVGYVAFCDMSGGSVDSAALAIGHEENGMAVVDCLRERKAPHSPDNVVKEFAGLLRSYGLYTVTGDRYAGAWPRERYRAHGIEYVPSEKPKSAIYVEALSVVNGRRCELLDLPRVTAQLVALERRSGFGASKDTVDHPPGGHDDSGNAVAGCIGIVVSGIGGVSMGAGEARTLGDVTAGLEQAAPFEGMGGRWSGSAWRDDEASDVEAAWRHQHPEE